jgi:hypothetical protein
LRGVTITGGHFRIQNCANYRTRGMRHALDLEVPLAGERVERRLTAILAADVTAYSRLTGLHEEETHFGLQREKNRVSHWHQCRRHHHRPERLSTIRPLETIREHEARMSGMGQTRHFDRAPITSDLPGLADNFGVRRHVSKVPATDMNLRSGPLLRRQTNEQASPANIPSL